MKLDKNTLDILIDRKVVRFIAQPNAEGYCKAVVVGPTSHMYSVERVSNGWTSDYITTNNIYIAGINKEYKIVMDYLKDNQYEELL